MELLIIRHADAGDAHEWAKKAKLPDSQRPISEKGHEQMSASSRGLETLVPRVDLLATSPYTRAMQTAEIVLTRYKDAAREVTDTLVPDADPDAFVKWLRFQGPREVVAAVGHEPHLSTLATWLISGSKDSRIELKKGGACLIEFERFASKGEGTLQWLMSAKHLKAL